jgi:RNA polymerase-binding transcription factor
MVFGNGEGQLKVPNFHGVKKKQYEALLSIRDKFNQQMEFHSGEALNTNQDAGEKNGMSTHMADLGSDNFRHDMELAMITNEGDVVEKIDEAIQRLINNEYGKCMDCTVKITKERLEAKPYAMFCINCKSIREKNSGMRPDYN